MPSFSILEQVLAVERYRQRVSEKRGGYAMPALGRKRVASEQGPFLVTNARGQFVPTRPSRDGYINYGFSPSPLDESQDDLLLALYGAASQLSCVEGATTRCSSVREAMDRLKASGLPPRSIVIPATTFQEIVPGTKLEASRSGYVTRIEENVRVFVAPLPEGSALVLPAQETLGLFTRVGGYVGIVVQRANRTLLVVGRGMA